MVTISVPQGMPRPSSQGPPSPSTPRRKMSEMDNGGGLTGNHSGMTPVKRSQGQEPFPITTKRQRSFGGEVKKESEESFPALAIDTDFKPFQASTFNSNLLKNHIKTPNSPTILKSSLKPSTPKLIDTVRSTTDSPSENDKRGFYFDYVKKALSDKMRGRDKEYLELVAQFNLPSQSSSSSIPPALGLLQMLLHALTGVASKLDRRNHSALVNAILTLPWATMGGDVFARIWIRFVCTLCSGRNEWLSEVLTRAIKGLSFRSDWRSLSYISGGATSTQKPTRRVVYARIHTLLRSLLSLIPTLPSQLAPLIQKYFPHKSDGIREHVVFIQNMFEISEYVDDLKPEIMELVIGRSVEIDVEIQIELDELEEAEADLDEADLEGLQDTKKLLEGDLLDEALDADSDSDEDDIDTSDDDAAGLDDIDSEGDDDDVFNKEISQTERERIRQVRQLAEKLDALMSALFRNMEMMDKRYSDASKGIIGKQDINPGRAIVLRNEQFGNLLRIFERTLLPTFKSRHVQFLLFWCASMERNYSEVFIGMLLNKAIYTSSSDEFDPQTGWRIKEGSPVVIRIAAASYVASLVARAKYIDAEDAKIIMLNLCAFLDAHMDAHSQGALATQSPTGFESDALSGPHAMFYAVAQACFYIFCFRWRDLHSTDGPTQGEDDVTDEDDDDDELINSNRSNLDGSGRVQWCTGIESIKRAILSQFNPLAYCSSTVVRQFASVAQLTGFMYCWNVIERNSRSNARKREGSATTPTLSRTNSVSSFHSPDPQRADSSSTVTSHMASLYTALDQQSPLTPTKQQQGGNANPTSKSEIDSFFPFDPYRLRGSTKWIEPIYREWSDVAPEGMLDESDDEEDENESQSADDDGESVSSDSSAEQIRPSPVSIARTGLRIPTNMRHKPVNPSKLSNAHASQSFGASVSTNESSSMAQSLEAMSISPRYV